MFLKKINHTKHAIKCRTEVFKTLKSFINTPNIYVQDRENFFTKTFKTFTNFDWIEVFIVSRGEISLEKLISGSFSELKKISFTVKGLYEIDSKFASGAISVFNRISFLKIPKIFD